MHALHTAREGRALAAPERAVARVDEAVRCVRTRALDARRAARAPVAEVAVRTALAVHAGRERVRVAVAHTYSA